MYLVLTENDESHEYESLEEAEKIFENWKDNLMTEGVTAYETYVELVESENNFENYRVIKKVIAVVDDERTELGSPREEGFDWDYWAKWQDIVEHT